MLRHRRPAALVAAVLAAVLAAGFGAQRAEAARAAGVNAHHARVRSVSCWADISYPAHIGSNVVTTATWQCSPGTEQQIAPLVSLTWAGGTRYTHSTQCYSTTYCVVTVSAPWTDDNPTWTARADYAYVVDYSGAASYFFGGSVTAYVP